MKIAIIGGGWLGLPLAQTLAQNGHLVVASKRTEKGVLELQKQQIDACKFTLGDDLNAPALNTLFSTDVLVINIAPGRKTIQPDQFVTDMSALITHAKQQGTKYLLFISTTAVYGNVSRIVYEYSELDPQTDSAKAHVRIEDVILSTFNQNASIFRLAGLVSQDRHPAKYLSAKQNLENGQQAVNLIHRDDVITAIDSLISGKHFGQTFHLSASEHPSRAEYYTHAAQALGLPAPHFAKATSKEIGKRINSALTVSTLGITLKYPSPYDMV